MRKGRTKYTPEEYEVFSQSVQKAWRHLYETGQSIDEIIEKAALSHAVLHAAASGERSEPLLIAYALARVGPVKSQIKQRLGSDSSMFSGIRPHSLKKACA
jgi:hypothetical protein